MHTTIRKKLCICTKRKNIPIFLGTAYNFILNTFDMSEETRKTFQELDVLYGPTNCVKNIFGTIKGQFM